MERVAKWLLVAAGAFVACGALASLVWAAITFSHRPLDGVEGEILFEADRIRRGFPLYVDPSVGAAEYGEPPARYLVLYPPLWSWALSHVPSYGGALGRFASTWAWIGTFAWILRGARLSRWIVAAFAFGAFTLVIYAASARPDAVAVLFAGVALDRAARRTTARGEASVDAISGVLFALAAWTKPNVVGAAAGAFAAAALAAAASGAPRSARRALRAVRAVRGGALGAVTTSAAIACVLHVTSHGAWLHHLLLSTAQPPSLAQWTGQLASRGPFFAFPLGLAIAIGWRQRKDPAIALATGALVASTAWCVLSLAKIGSASNYFMEPLVCAAVLVTRAELPRPRVLLAAAICVQSAWVSVASVRSAVERVPRDMAAADALAEARQRCRGVVIADEPGLEEVVDGRIVETPFQSTHLAIAGKFPVDAWVRDVTHPNVRCLLMQDDLLERPLEQVDVDHDRFPPELRRVLGENYVKKAERGGIVRYERR